MRSKRNHKKGSHLNSRINMRALFQGKSDFNERNMYVTSIAKFYWVAESTLKRMESVDLISADGQCMWCSCLPALISYG